LEKAFTEKNAQQALSLVGGGEKHINRNKSDEQRMGNHQDLRGNISTWKLMFSEWLNMAA
jgi:hypothetical protein